MGIVAPQSSVRPTWLTRLAITLIVVTVVAWLATAAGSSFIRLAPDAPPPGTAVPTPTGMHEVPPQRCGSFCGSRLVYFGFDAGAPSSDPVALTVETLRETGWTPNGPPYVKGDFSADVWSQRASANPGAVVAVEVTFSSPSAKQRFQTTQATDWTFYFAGLAALTVLTAMVVARWYLVGRADRGDEQID